jgi:hypothetical protein
LQRETDSKGELPDWPILMLTAIVAIDGEM